MNNGYLTSEKLKEIKERAKNKWASLGFLDGLSGHVKPSIATLFECEASKLLKEENSTMFNQWCVYILECSDGSLYTGITNNLNKRIQTHNDGKGAKYTKSRLPVALKWSQTCENRSEASKMEYKTKKLTRKAKLKLINEK